MNRPGVHKTVYIELSGKCKYLNTHSIDDYGNWGVVLYLDEDSANIFKKMKEGWYEDVEGIKNELHQDEEGYFVRLKRPHKKEYKNKTLTFTPPLLLEADGKTPMIGKLVGNGSSITCTIEMYFYKTPSKRQGSAIRLNAIRVDDLIEYESTRDLTSREEKMTKSLARPTETANW